MPTTASGALRRASEPAPRRSEAPEGQLLRLRPAAQSIMIVLHDLPLGGSERIAIRLANRWAAAGRRVTLLIGARHGPLEPLIADDVEIRVCDPPIPRGRGSRRRLGAALAAAAAQQAPDLIFVPGNFHWPVTPALERLPPGRRPTIVTQIGTPLYRHGRGPLRQLAYNARMRRRFACVDAAVSLSPVMKSEADRILRRRLTSFLRLPALDDGAPAPVQADAAGRLIVAAGRLEKVKGFDVAIEAFARLSDPGARLAILGEGSEREHLVALARRLGVEDRVELPGYVPDIRPWLDRARLFLLSSWYEGYGAVVVEALAAGRPVVATDCTPAVDDLIRRPGHGAVAPVGDVRALAACLERILEQAPPDPDRLAGSVEDYRIGPIAEEYLHLFDAAHARALARKPPPQV